MTHMIVIFTGCSFLYLFMLYFVFMLYFHTHKDIWDTLIIGAYFFNFHPPLLKMQYSWILSVQSLTMVIFNLSLENCDKKAVS